MGVHRLGGDATHAVEDVLSDDNPFPGARIDQKISQAGGWDGLDPHALASWGGGARPDGVYTRGGDAASISWLDAFGRIQVDGDGAGAAVAGLGGLAGPDQGLITVVGVARHQNPGANAPYLVVDEDPENSASNNFARVDFKNTQFTTKVAGGAATHTDISGLVDETLWHVWVIEIDYAAGETRLIIDDVPGAAADVTHAETPNGILYTFSRVGDGGDTGRLEVAGLTYRRDI